LLLPSALEPGVPLPLFEGALRRHLTNTLQSATAPPLLIWPGEALVVSLAAARPLDRKRAEEWLTSHELPRSFSVEIMPADGHECLGTPQERALHG
jgi:hypothetical protein